MAQGDNRHSGSARKLQKVWRIDGQRAACHWPAAQRPAHHLFAELSSLLLPVLACWPACWAPAAMLPLAQSSSY